MKQVTVVIPNWNGKDLLGPCLESLYHQEFQDFEAIVVDNGSTDGSISFVQEKFPKVRVIRFEKNRGFSAAVNAGITASDSSYIALLNNDTEVHPLWLKELVGALEATPKASSAASKILFFHDPRLINSAGDEFSWFGVAYQRGKGCVDGPRYHSPCFVFSACAAAALYRRQVFDRVGLFDETFFAYLEDVDLGFRAQLAGYRCLFVPKAIVYHKYQMTSSRVSTFRLYLKERNKHFVLMKNLPVRLFFLCFPLIILQEVFCLIQAIRAQHLFAYLRALGHAMRHLPGMLRCRHKIQAHRVVNDTYVRKLMCFKEPLRIFYYKLRGSRVTGTY